MDATKHYQEYWGKKREVEKFADYERNLALVGMVEKGEKLLDVGCGDGVVGEYFAKRGVDVYGIDLSQKAIKVARARGVKAKLGNVEERFPFDNSTFDVVFWGDNVEHLFNPALTLSEIHRVLKKGGKLILSCPNMSYWRYRVYYFLYGKLPDTEWTGNPPWYWSHIRFFNISILTDFLEAEGFRLRQVMGVNKRYLEGILSKVFPGVFGMILVVEATKK